MNQNDALQALEWLHSERDEDRRTGRSTVLALSYLRRAARNREGGPIFVGHLVGHLSSPRARVEEASIRSLAQFLNTAIDLDGRGNLRVLPGQVHTMLFRDPFPFHLLGDSETERRANLSAAERAQPNRPHVRPKGRSRYTRLAEDDD